MAEELKLLAAADRHRAAFEESRAIRVSAVTPVEASVAKMKHTILGVRWKTVKADGSAVTKLPQKLVSNTVRKSNATRRRNTAPDAGEPTLWGEKRARLKDGFYTREAKSERRRIRILLRLSRT
jgi:hypothetical protein